ncbi:nuclear transport factor 2 family protein [Nocardia sp. NPDC003482]
MARPDSGPRAVLERFRQAAIDQSVEAMTELYAEDAVHEFPFSRPGLPTRLEGRDRIVEFITAGWRSGVLRYESYRTLAIHDTLDPDTIVVEQEAVGTSTVSGAVALPNVVVLTVSDGRIRIFRDYVNILAAAEATGITIG